MYKKLNGITLTAPQECIKLAYQYLRVSNPVVTLIGSSNFEEEFKAMHRLFYMAGCPVFAPGASANKENLPELVRKNLMKAYWKMIDLSDIVFVINKDGYMGVATQDKLLYAVAQHKIVGFMEHPGEQCDKDLRLIVQNEFKEMTSAH